MKKTFVIICFVSNVFCFAQQTPSPTINNTIFNYSLTTPHSGKQSLNMKSFIRNDFMENTSIISELLLKSNSKRIQPNTTMPIFSPEGEFHLEIYEVEEDIDHKLKIFDLEKSKYFLRSFG